MANYKRKKPKTHEFITCPYCMFKGIDSPSRLRGRPNAKSTFGRHSHHDLKQPQFYEDTNGRVV